VSVSGPFEVGIADLACGVVAGAEGGFYSAVSVDVTNNAVLVSVEGADCSAQPSVLYPGWSGQVELHYRKKPTEDVLAATVVRLGLLQVGVLNS
jgi:hypothetical protein